MKKYLCLILLLIATYSYADTVSERIYGSLIVDTEIDVSTTFEAAASQVSVINTGLVVTGTTTTNSLDVVDWRYTTQTGLDGTTTIPLTSLYIGVESSASDVTVTADPAIESGTISGQLLTVEGTSDENPIILQDGNGLSMSASVTLASDCTVTYKWNDVKNKWIMQYSDTK